jgi:predicted amidohydrolase
MQNRVRVAAAQIEIDWLKPEVNLAKIGSVIERITSEDKPDLMVFPELCNSGYLKGRENKDFPEFSKNYYRVAEKIPGDFTDVLCDHARKFNLYLAIGLLEVHPTIPATLFNSAVLINSKGEIVGHYRKVHIPGEEKHYFYPGNRVEVYTTELGNIGLMVCADNSFPEQARVLSLKGAEIICVSYARPKGVGFDPELYYRIVSCRAFENNNYFIACNRVGREDDVVFEGRSCICGPKGEFLALSQIESEEVIIADLSAETMVTARIHYSRFRDRRPDLYNILGLPFGEK